MHSFQYDEAAAAFRRAQAIEPGFAMAYWGEAMTHNHPIWDERDAAAAREALARLAPTPEARAARARTARERAWLGAAEVLWADGPKPLRDTLYADAMAAVARDFPDDEADAFHALAILGLSQGVRDIPSYMRGGKIALDLLARAPDHPGAAHYVIHAFDDPDHAILALDAARAYSRIAPDAGHAQHMTTHIFLALGDWDAVARQNIVAMQASTGNSDSLEWRPGHYTWWLNYARLQQGKWDDARRWVMRQKALLPADAPPGRRGFLQVMVDEWQLNTGLLDQLPGGPAPEYLREASSTQVLAWALEAARHPDAMERLELLAAAELRPRNPDMTEDLELVAPQVEALGLQANGMTDSAVAVLRAAVALEAARPIDFGPPAILRPAHEALAELLLSAGRYADAKAAYDRALARTPGRSRTLAGLAIAARESGDAAASERAMTQLRQNFHDADPGALESLLESIRRPAAASR